MPLLLGFRRFNKILSDTTDALYESAEYFNKNQDKIILSLREMADQKKVTSINRLDEISRHVQMCYKNIGDIENIGKDTIKFQNIEQVQQEIDDVKMLRLLASTSHDLLRFEKNSEQDNIMFGIKELISKEIKHFSQCYSDWARQYVYANVVEKEPKKTMRIFLSFKKGKNDESYAAPRAQSVISLWKYQEWFITILAAAETLFKRPFCRPEIAVAFHIPIPHGEKLYDAFFSKRCVEAMIAMLSEPTKGMEYIKDVEYLKCVEYIKMNALPALMKMQNAENYTQISEIFLYLILMDKHFFADAPLVEKLKEQFHTTTAAQAKQAGNFILLDFQVRWNNFKEKTNDQRNCTWADFQKFLSSLSETFCNDAYKEMNRILSGMREAPDSSYFAGLRGTKLYSSVRLPGLTRAYPTP